MTSYQPLLWVDVLRGKYLKNSGSFLNTSSNPSASWLWKGLLKNRKVVQKGACISISCGLNVDIWNSPWIPSTPKFKPIPNCNLNFLPSLVADLILEGERSWNALSLADLFEPLTVQRILSIHLPQVTSFDK